MVLLQCLRFFSFLVYAYMAGYILYRGPKSMLNISCSLLISTFALWTIGDAISGSKAITVETSILFQNISAIGWISFSSHFVFFSLFFSKNKKLLNKKSLLISIFVIPLLFIGKQWTSSLINPPVMRNYGWEFSWKETYWTYLYYAYYISFMLFGIYLIYRHGLQSKKVADRKQAGIVVSAITISLIGGTITDVILPLLDIHAVPQLGNVILLVFAGAMIYAIVKYEFLRITPAIAAGNIISNMEELLVLTDPEGIILSENKAVAAALKYEPTELTGQSVATLFTESGLGLSLLERVNRGEVLKNQEACLLVKGDGEITVIVSCSALKDDEGEIKGIVFIATDITARKQAEEELRLFRSLIEQSNDAIEVVDPETGRFLDANEKAWTSHGYSREELLELTVFDIALNLDESQFRKVGEELKKSGSIVFEGRSLRKDGSNFPVEVSLKYIHHKRDYVVADVRDITARKQAEEQLQLFRSLLDQSADSVFVVDAATGRILDVNEQACSSLRYSREELLQLRVLNIQTAMHDDVVWQAHVGDLRSKGKMLVEFDALRKDGSRSPVEVNTRFVEIGDKAYIISVVRDITARKLAEETLQTERALLRTVIDNVPDMIYAKDRLCRKTLANKVEVRTLRANSEADVLGKDDFDFYPKELAEGFFNDDQTVIQEGIPVLNKEAYVIDENGETKWLLTSKLPLRDKAGQIIGLVGISRDITGSRKAERELIVAKEKAEESDRLKSSFLANISHEFRTPMNSILGFAEILKEPGLTGEQQQEYISIIEQSGERMLNVINNIVDISKIESGQLKISVSEVNINEEIEYIYNLFRPEIEKKGIQFFPKNHLPDDQAIVKTDRAKVVTIFSNLIRNAVKFTSQGYIEFGCGSTGSPTGGSTGSPTGGGAGSPTGGVVNEMTFFVKDTGIGIHPDYKEFIFERFRQGSESLNKKYEGAGLGLTISKAFVEMLGGKIWVESEEGKGATFYFTIPR